MDEEVIWPEIRMYDASTMDVLNRLDDLSTPSLSNNQRNAVVLVEVLLKITKARLGEKQASRIIFLPTKIANNPRVSTEGFQNLPLDHKVHSNGLRKLMVGGALLPYSSRAFQDHTLSNTVELRC